jgi:hypothetical protein
MLIENNMVAPVTTSSSPRATEPSASESAKQRKTLVNDNFIKQLVNKNTNYNNTHRPSQSLVDPSSSNAVTFKVYTERAPDFLSGAPQTGNSIEARRKPLEFEVIYVETLHEFYVIIMGDMQFRAANNDMQYFYGKKSNLAQPLMKEGNACVYHDNSEMLWFRARIKTVCDADHCLVKLVDRGETKYANRAMLRVIHDKYLEIPCQAVKASLSDLDDKRDEEIDESVSARFRELTLRKKLLGKVEKTRVVESGTVFGDESTLYLLNLFDEESGESIYQQLVQDNLNATRTLVNTFKPSVKSALEETRAADSSAFLNVSNVNGGVGDNNDINGLAQQYLAASHTQQMQNNNRFQQQGFQARQPKPFQDR